MIKALIIGTLLVGSSLSGQNLPKPDSSSAVTIVTEPIGADIYIDSMFVGKSPVLNTSLQRGTHRIKAFYPSVFSWNATVLQDSLEVVEAGNLQKRMVLGRTLSVQTEPSGSTVLFNGRLLGVTPLYFCNVSSFAGNLMIQKDGYDSLVVPLNERSEGFIRLRLRPVRIPEASFPGGDLRGPDFLATDRWPTYVSGLTMIVSGVTSAYLKNQANKEFDGYLVSNDPAGLSRTRRLDRGAAVSLVISQIGFVVLSYFLLSE